MYAVSGPSIQYINWTEEKFVSIIFLKLKIRSFILCICYVMMYHKLIFISGLNLFAYKPCVIVYYDPSLYNPVRKGALYFRHIGDGQQVFLNSLLLFIFIHYLLGGEILWLNNVLNLTKL